MIRKTIAEHFDKEKRLGPLGIKTLTLFFIDEVARYRSYDEDGNQVKGDYARIFEDEYRRAARHSDYRALFEGVDIDAMAERRTTAISRWTARASGKTHTRATSATEITPNGLTA